MSAAAASSDPAPAPAAAPLPDWLEYPWLDTWRAGYGSPGPDNSVLMFQGAASKEQAQQVVDMLRTNALPSVRCISIPNKTRAKLLLPALHSNNHIQTIHLEKPAAESLRLLATMLQHNRHITSLELGSGMDDAAADALCTLLAQTDAPLLELHFTKGPISGAVMGKLATAFPSNSTLRRLYLSSHNQTDYTPLIAALAASQIQALQIKLLSWSPATDAALHDLLLQSRSLQKFELLTDDSALNSSTESVFAALAASSSLQEFKLQSSRLSVPASFASFASALGSNRTLRVLDLAKWQCFGAGVGLLAAGLQHNQALQSLHLAGVSDSAACTALAAALRVNRTLTELSAGFVDGDMEELAPALAVNSGLQKLKLGIHKRGMAHLGAALQSNRSLTSLHINGTYGYHHDFGDEGVEPLAAALLVNRSLTQLHLRMVGMSAVGMRALREALRSNSALTDLTVGEWKYDLSGEVALLLSESTTLRRLDACNMKDVPAIAAALKHNRSLQSLVLEATGCEVEDTLSPFLDCMQSNTTLTHMKYWTWGDQVMPRMEPLLERNRKMQAQAQADVLAASGAGAQPEHEGSTVQPVREQQSDSSQLEAPAQTSEKQTEVLQAQQLAPTEAQQAASIPSPQPPLGARSPDRTGGSACVVPAPAPNPAPSAAAASAAASDPVNRGAGATRDEPEARRELRPRKKKAKLKH